jgi:uncharacterized protein (DUF362 family)
MTWDRRRFVATSAALAAGATARAFVKPRHGTDVRKARSRVAILSVAEYSSNLEAVLLPALKEFDLNIAVKSVLLKPNLVEHIPKLPVNTHPKLVGAAASCFLRLGAARVVVGEGPGHERDTEKVVTEAGLARKLGDQSIQFSDLNRDELVRVKTVADYSGLGDLWLTADSVASGLGRVHA